MAFLTTSQIQNIREHMTEDPSVLSKKFKAKKEGVSKQELEEVKKKLIHLRWMEVNRQMLYFQQFIHMSANFR